jgi:hypothetical protein
MPAAVSKPVVAAAPRPLLIVAAKAPIPGRVKTRLAPLVAAPDAARLARAFLTDTLALAASPALADIDVWLALDGDPAALAPTDGDANRELPLPPFTIAQVGNSLGERLVHMMGAGFEAGRPAVCVIGTDAPHLPAAFVREAFGRLTPVAWSRDAPTGSPVSLAEVVLGPSDDGGYYLVGTTRSQPALFENIPWSGPNVLAVTRERAHALGLSVALLPPWYDVDTPDDLRRLRRDLARGACHAPATEQALDSLLAPPVSL